MHQINTFDFFYLCCLKYDTSRHLEWLKTVKESHGSVAMTSLVQAKTINSSGVYVVGHLNIKSGSTEQGRQLSMNNVIQLTVPTKDGSEEGQRKTYSVDELKDLQSKLMLIAGKAEKGKDEVEQFVKVSYEKKNPIYLVNRRLHGNEVRTIVRYRKHS